MRSGLRLVGTWVDPITVFGEASTDSLRQDWPQVVDFPLERARQAA